MCFFVFFFCLSLLTGACQKAEVVFQILMANINIIGTKKIHLFVCKDFFATPYFFFSLYHLCD